MLADLDLNLLRVFDALLDEGSVTGAAGRLNLSVPATSRALGRLRRAMGDPIFVRSGRGLAPTPFATRSAPQVKHLLDGARALLAGEREFTPAELTRAFSVRINDGVGAPLVAPLVAAVTSDAPGVTVRMLSEGTEDIEGLRNGTVDLDIGVRHGASPDVRSEVLYADRIVAFVATGSRLGTARRPSARQLCGQPHIAASRRGLSRGPVDDALDAAGLRRRVTAVVPSFTVAMLAAASSDLVATVPERLARGFAPLLHARWFALPFELPPIELTMQWHARLDTDPAHRWFRQKVIEALASRGTS